MHWVKATTLDGRVQYVNLAQVASMLPSNDGTVIFLGAVAAKADGSPLYATTMAKESPDQLLALPGSVAPGPGAATVATVKPVAAGVAEAPRKKVKA